MRKLHLVISIISMLIVCSAMAQNQNGGGRTPQSFQGV